MLKKLLLNTVATQYFISISLTMQLQQILQTYFTLFLSFFSFSFTDSTGFVFAKEAILKRTLCLFAYARALRSKASRRFSRPAGLIQLYEENRPVGIPSGQRWDPAFENYLVPSFWVVFLIESQLDVYKDLTGIAGSWQTSCPGCTGHFFSYNFQIKQASVTFD